MPSLKPGKYTVQLVLDTKSPLGVLTSKREFVVDDPIYDTLSSAYSEALRTKNAPKAARARSEMLDKWFPTRLRPSRLVNVGKLNIGDPPAPTIPRATLKWYSKARYLEIVADVRDPNFSTRAPEDKPWEASSLELYVCPSGMSEDINQFFVTPKGTKGIAAVLVKRAVEGAKIKASWKRTAKGYMLDVQIPWAALKGYQKRWSVMPVEAAVNSKAPNGRCQLVMTRPGAPWEASRTYAALRAP